MSADQMVSQTEGRGAPQDSRFFDPLIVGGVVLFVCLLGIWLRPVGLLSTFWPANAVLLGLLVRNPRLATPLGWLAAAAGFLAADLLTGSTLAKTSLLTAGNLAGVLVGYGLFRHANAEDRRLMRPASILTLASIVVAAALGAGVVMAAANAFLFNHSAFKSFLFWFATELTNYMVVLPVMLTFPGLTAFMAWARRMGSWRPNAPEAAPLLAYAFCLAMVPAVGGPGALAFPVPALLWCALTYGLAATTLLTLSYAVWTLLILSTHAMALGVSLEAEFDLVSLRLGVMLAALAPIAVASVMATRNAVLREAMVARKAAEDAMAARTLLLATMAHELRSPLTAVVGFSSLMSRQGMGPLGSPKYLDYAQSIELAGSHLSDLVTDLLDTAKVEAGQVDLRFADVSSKDVVEQSLRMVRGLGFDAGVTIHMVPGDWPEVDVDSRAIKQVLINLLSNAIKFSPQNAVVEISGETRADRLIVRVRDSGRGISVEDLAVLGRAYTQVGDFAQRRRGTGLGLALSSQLISEHGGRLNLESELGIGTTASFDLPLAYPPA